MIDPCLLQGLHQFTVIQYRCRPLSFIHELHDRRGVVDYFDAVTWVSIKLLLDTTRTWMAQGALAIVLVSVSGKMNGYHVTSDSDTPSENSKFCNTTTIAEDLQTMSKQRDIFWIYRDKSRVSYWTQVVPSRTNESSKSTPKKSCAFNWLYKHLSFPT